MPDLLRHPSVKDFQRHIERFGADGVIETAAEYLPDEQVDGLRLFIRRRKATAKRQRIAALRARG